MHVSLSVHVFLMFLSSIRWPDRIVTEIMRYNAVKRMEGVISLSSLLVIPVSPSVHVFLRTFLLAG